MAIKVFYHICAITRALEVVEKQVRCIQYSGLYDDAYAIYCYISGDEDLILKIVDLLEKSGKKFIIVKRVPNDTSYERLTLEDIHNHVDRTDSILYIHSKGVTPKYQDHPSILTCIDDWMYMMMYYLVRHYKKCIAKLENYDTVGVNYSQLDMNVHIYYHWSGNYWWVRGDYFLTLPHKIGLQYLEPEVNFLFLNNPRYFEMHSSKIVEDHYIKRYEPFKYIDNIID